MFTERTQWFLSCRLCGYGVSGFYRGGFGLGEGAVELHSLSPAWEEDRWLVLLFNSSSRLYVRPVGERVRREKRGQWARIGWDQDQMPAEQWGFWKKCGRKRGACFVQPPHCRLEWGSSDLMKCIPKRGRQPRLGDKGTCQMGACEAGMVGGSNPLMDCPEQCTLSVGWEKPSIHPCAY